MNLNGAGRAAHDQRLQSIESTMHRHGFRRTVMLAPEALQCFSCVQPTGSVREQPVMLRLVLAAALVAGVSSHASMTKPFPRNARDGNLTEFRGGAWPPASRSAQVGNSGCSCANPKGCAAGLGRPETNGQPCLWFSQGCSPGCATCTGTNGHTNSPLCSTFMRPTNNDTSTRTEDPTDPASFLYTPWRSPGHAPTADPW